MKTIKILFFSSLFLLLSSINVQASTVNKPIISDLNSNIKNFSEPFVSGTTDKFTSVLVYIDGNFWSKAETVSSSDRDLFYFFLKKLPDEGSHKLILISRDLNGVLSPPTNEFDFFITHELAVPKILKASFDKNVYFFGESLNENFIDMYLDGSLFASYFINKNSDNTFKFNERNISKGQHKIFFIARDRVGRKSNASKELSIYFNKKEEVNYSQKKTKVKTPAITKKKIEQKQTKAKPTISDKGVREIIDEEIIIEGVSNIDDVNKTTGKDNDEDEVLDNILDKIHKDKATESGAISEKGEHQSDLKWNLIIFFGFLLAVIFWIIWVNREIKEENNSVNKEEEKRE